MFDRLDLDDIAARQRVTLVAAAGYEINDSTIERALLRDDRSFLLGDIAAGQMYNWASI